MTTNFNGKSLRNLSWQYRKQNYTPEFAFGYDQMYRLYDIKSFSQTIDCVFSAEIPTSCRPHFFRRHPRTGALNTVVMASENVIHYQLCQSTNGVWNHTRTALGLPQLPEDLYDCSNYFLDRVSKTVTPTNETLAVNERTRAGSPAIDTGTLQIFEDQVTLTNNFLTGRYSTVTVLFTTIGNFSSISDQGGFIYSPFVLYDVVGNDLMQGVAGGSSETVTSNSWETILQEFFIEAVGSHPDARAFILNFRSMVLGRSDSNDIFYSIYDQPPQSNPRYGGRELCYFNQDGSVTGCFHNISTYEPYHLLKVVNASHVVKQVIDVNERRSVHGVMVDRDDDHDSVALHWSASSVFFARGDTAPFVLFIFVPDAFFLDDIKKAETTVIIVTIVIIVVGSVLCFLWLTAMFDKLSELALKMSLDPFDPALKVVVQQQHDDRGDEEKKQAEKKQKESLRHKSSKSKMEEKRAKKLQAKVSHAQSAFNIFAFPVEETAELEEAYGEFRQQIDQLRSFMPKREDTFLLGSGTTLTPTARNLVDPTRRRTRDDVAGKECVKEAQIKSKNNDTEEDHSQQKATTTAQPPHPSPSTSSVLKKNKNKKNKTGKRRNDDDDDGVDDDIGASSSGKGKSVRFAFDDTFEESGEQTSYQTTTTESGLLVDPDRISRPSSRNSNVNDDQNNDEKNDINAWTSHQIASALVCCIRIRNLVDFEKRDHIFQNNNNSFNNNNNKENDALSRWNEELIERVTVVVQTLDETVLKPNGAHLIEYRNDFFLVVLRLSERKSRSKLAMRFLEDLQSASEKISQKLQEQQQQHKDAENTSSNINNNKKNTKSVNRMYSHVCLFAGVAIGPLRLIRCKNSDDFNKNRHHQNEQTATKDDASLQERNDEVFANLANELAHSKEKAAAKKSSHHQQQQQADGALLASKSKSKSSSTGGYSLRPITFLGNAVTSAFKMERCIRNHVEVLSRQQQQHGAGNKNGHDDEDRLYQYTDEMEEDDHDNCNIDSAVALITKEEIVHGPNSNNNNHPFFDKNNVATRDAHGFVYRSLAQLPHAICCDLQATYPKISSLLAYKLPYVVSTFLPPASSSRAAVQQQQHQQQSQEQDQSGSAAATTTNEDNTETYPPHSPPLHSPASEIVRLIGAEFFFPHREQNNHNQGNDDDNDDSRRRINNGQLSKSAGIDQEERLEEITSKMGTMLFELLSKSSGSSEAATNNSTAADDVNALVAPDESMMEEIVMRTQAAVSRPIMFNDYYAGGVAPMLAPP